MTPGEQSQYEQLLEGRIRGLRTRAEKAEAAIARVRHLHRQGYYGTCWTCMKEPWPCPTIRALDGER